MHKINVVNKTRHAPTDNDFYVGRGSSLGNPFTSKDLSKTKAQFRAKNKTEAIKFYREYLIKKIDERDTNICNDLNRIYLKALDNDVNLVCYCAPNDCHAEVIKGIIVTKLIKKYMNNGK